MWVHLFIAEKVATVPEVSVIKSIGNDAIIQQDNTGIIKLEMNGKESSTKHTRHINIRYFSVTSKVKSDEVKLLYHPTKDMVSEYLTKPLQRLHFCSHFNVIMRLSKESTNRYKQA